MDYYQFNIQIHPEEPWKEIIIQELADIGFDSFMDNEDELQAFVSQESFTENNFNRLIEKYSSKEVELTYTKIEIPSQNWNATWEADYNPVIINNQLLIRAPFHPQDDSFKYSVEIQPQMSFGTGHHQTTSLLCGALLEHNLKENCVLDVGTGTGVLSILSSLLGAKSVVGTDLEVDAVQNAIENCGRNHIQNVIILKGDIEIVPKRKFDVILANINKNVLKKHMKQYAHLIQKNGFLFLSGFFGTDVDEMIDEARKEGFIWKETFLKEEWAAVKFQKKL